jgi:hypothetical protein
VKTFKVRLTGDLLDETTETYYVNLQAPVNATLADGQAEGRIVDDDPAPPGSPDLAIADTARAEGNAGTANAVFTITLGAPAAATVKVTWETGAGGTATAGDDYLARAGTVSFAPGQTSRTVSVPVVGDAAAEGDETFFVNLTSAANAVIVDGQARGTVQDDD